MAGIPGLDPFGAFHGVLGLISVVLGGIVVLRRKAGAAHRRTGIAYTMSMVLLNVTAFGIYDLFGGFGPFHWLAIVSLATTFAGFVPVWLRRPRCWLDIHARCMSWSYAGLIAAFMSEIGSRIPGVSLLYGVLVPTTGVMLVAAVLIYGRVPEMVNQMRRAGVAG